jgi:hypothetical protein
MIFNFFIINLFVIILINRIKIKASSKILLFFISIFTFNLYISDNYIIFLELLILLLCSVHIFINIYTVKYSSVRIEILNYIVKKKKYDDNELYLDRKNRFKKNNKSLMKKEIFTFINVIISFFRRCFF